MQEINVSSILSENAERRAKKGMGHFSPITGENSIGDRVKVELTDFPIKVQYLPKAMIKNKLVKKIVRAGSIKNFLATLKFDTEDSEDAFETVVETFVRLRFKYDFPFWAATLVYIKDKNPGRPDCLFRLNYPQLRYVSLLEQMRIEKKPIRICMLKARQWGGSTCTQIYMAWLQLVHRPNLNSLIVAHVNGASEKIKAMFRKMIERFPAKFLHPMGEPFSENEKKLVWDGNSDFTQRIPQRGATISVGSSESPTSSRGGDYSLVHLSEIGLFKDTEKIKPAALIRAATSGVLFKPYTMIVYESTADGVGTFFHKEYTDAKSGQSQFTAFFVPWFDIENYEIPFSSKIEEETFAKKLYENRNNSNTLSAREENGVFLWRLWKMGATLEGIKWYIEERKKYTSHSEIAAEFPSDDVEAFVNANANVFSAVLIDKMRSTCRPPYKIGGVYADSDTGKNSLRNLRFKEDRQGMLWVWSLPDNNPNEKITERYLTVVDVGGRSSKADWSVIVVIDRLFMIEEGGKPSIAAQWYGHIDIDLLAWKAAQIAAFYDNSLLVIESNTLETHDKERFVDGDQSQYILNQIVDVYPNLYARKQSEDSIQKGEPRKWGFHTNVATKPMIISNLVKVIRENLYTERDERCLNEMMVYERKPNGSFGAVTGAHDDLLMTRAIGLHICFNEMDLPKIKHIEKGNNQSVTFNPRSISAATIG